MGCINVLTSRQEEAGGAAITSLSSHSCRAGRSYTQPKSPDPDINTSTTSIKEILGKGKIKDCQRIIIVLYRAINLTGKEILRDIKETAFTHRLNRHYLMKPSWVDHQNLHQDHPHQHEC